MWQLVGEASVVDGEEELLWRANEGVRWYREWHVEVCFGAPDVLAGIIKKGTVIRSVTCGCVFWHSIHVRRENIIRYCDFVSGICEWKEWGRNESYKEFKERVKNKANVKVTGKILHFGQDDKYFYT